MSVLGSLALSLLLLQLFDPPERGAALWLGIEQLRHSAGRGAGQG